MDGFEVDGNDEPKLYQECYELAGKIISGVDYLEYEEECTRTMLQPAVSS